MITTFIRAPSHPSVSAPSRASAFFSLHFLEYFNSENAKMKLFRLQLPGCVQPPTFECVSGRVCGVCVPASRPVTAGVQRHGSNLPKPVGFTVHDPALKGNTRSLETDNDNSSRSHEVRVSWNLNMFGSSVKCRIKVVAGQNPASVFCP